MKCLICWFLGHDYHLRRSPDVLWECQRCGKTQSASMADDLDDLGIVAHRAPRTHDYARRNWGHDYTFTPIEDGQRGHMIGWGRGIKPGDYLILSVLGTNRTTRYRVVSVDYKSDPPDMWTADVVFAPRT